MKRSVLFWPVVSAVAVLVLWLALCLLVIGIPVSSAPSQACSFSFPAFRLLGGDSDGWDWRLWLRLSSYFEDAVNGLWRLAPYAKLPEPEEEPTLELTLKLRPPEVSLHYETPLPPITTYARSDFQVEVWYSYPHGMVLLHIFLLPALHFAGVAFVVALLIVGVRTLAGGLLPRAPADERDEE